jgi:O-antigen/teichoic acid export membrane protein
MYNTAFVVPKREEDFLAMLKFCLISSFFGSLIFLVFLLIARSSFLNWISAEELGHFAYLLPAGLFLSSLVVSFQNWNVRRKEFKTNSISAVVTGTTDRGSQIGFGLSLGAVFSSLIFSKVLSDIMTLITLSKRTMISEIRKALSIPISEMKKTLLEYVKYPKFILTGNFINRLSGDIPLYLFAATFDLRAAGAFGFATAILNVPYKVIGGSISTVYFQKATELYNKDKKLLKEFSKSSFMKMTFLGSLAFGFVFGFGDIIFNIVFGSEWNLAGRIARVLSLYYIFKIVSSPFSTVLRSVKKEEYGLYLNIVLSVSRILGIFLGIMTGDLIYALICFTLGNVFGYLISNFLIFKAQDLPYFKNMVNSTLTIGLIFGIFYGIRLITFPYLQTLIYK